MTASHLNEEG